MSEKKTIKVEIPFELWVKLQELKAKGITYQELLERGIKTVEGAYTEREQEEAAYDPELERELLEVKSMLERGTTIKALTLRGRELLNYIKGAPLPLNQKKEVEDLVKEINEIVKQAAEHPQPKYVTQALYVRKTEEGYKFWWG